jgi:hypothetical protein
MNAGSRGVCGYAVSSGTQFKVPRTLYADGCVSIENQSLIFSELKAKPLVSPKIENLAEQAAINRIYRLCRDDELAARKPSAHERRSSSRRGCESSARSTARTIFQAVTLT